MTRLGCVFGLVVLGAACAGELQDPNRFTNVAALYQCDPAIDVEVQILAWKCAGCHGDLEPEAGLDLISPGVGERLYGVASRTCEGEVLLDYDNILSGFLYDKVSGGEPRCGERMPYGEEALTDAEIECLRLWLAGQHPEAES